MRELWGNSPPAPPEASWPLHRPVPSTLCWTLGAAAVLAPVAIRTFQRRTQD